MRISILAMLLLAGPALAADPAPMGPMEAPAPPPMGAEAEPAPVPEGEAVQGDGGIVVREGPEGTTIILPGGEALEPEVTIKRKGEQTLTEYRINGRLYMIKVKPARGPAYYLADTDGDGELESQQSELDAGFLIPKWILFSW